MTRIQEFTSNVPRPLPVLILADVSGSMSVDGKIEALNTAMIDMIRSFAEEPSGRAQIQVGVIVFGGNEAHLHVPLSPAAEVAWKPMVPNGKTPLGQALALARNLIENKDVIPSRAYRPVVVLVSDGVPTDEWRQSLGALNASARAAKSTRYAVMIGEDDEAENGAKMLAEFVGEGGVPVFRVRDVRQIKSFFKWLTMSVTERSKSASPNAPVAADRLDIEHWDYEY